MKAEREREAADEIARGNEAALRVRALADRTVVELVSESQRQAEITRGEADAERNAIFAESFGASVCRADCPLCCQSGDLHSM